MTADPHPTLPDPRTDDEDVEEDAGNGRSATAPAEGAREGGTPRDPALPDD